jgi:hypothetical protein
MSLVGLVKSYSEGTTPAQDMQDLIAHGDETSPTGAIVPTTN